jgi:hypothetical protein
MIGCISGWSSLISELEANAEPAKNAGNLPQRADSNSKAYCIIFHPEMPDCNQNFQPRRVKTGLGAGRIMPLMRQTGRNPCDA